MLSAAGTRYAKALLEVVLGGEFRADPKQIVEQLGSINALIETSPDLHNVLLSPAISQSRKRAVVARLIEPMHVSKAVRNFLFVFIDHRRIHEMPAIVEAFDHLLDERLGVVRGDVSSALDLSESQRSSLEAELSRLAGRKARLKFEVDPKLIGGVVARLGSTVYDGSVRGQLERLRLKLGANGGYSR